MKATSKKAQAFTKGDKIFEDNAKTIYQTEQDQILVQSFRDDLLFSSPLFDEPIMGRANVNNRISAFVAEQLNGLHIHTHYIERLNMFDQLIHRVDVLPLQVRVRNWVGDEVANHLGLPQGMKLPRPITELYHVRTDGKPALTNDDIAIAMNWVTLPELDDMMAMALRANDVLMGMYAVAGFNLTDFSLMFGRYIHHESRTIQMVIADDLTPDTCNLIDRKTGQKVGGQCANDVHNPMDANTLAGTYVTIGERLNVIK